MTDAPQHDAGSARDCQECPIATANRRRFVRDAAMAVAATFLAPALLSSPALASLIAETRPLKAKGPLLSYSIPGEEAVLVDSDNEVIIARTGRTVRAFSTRCPHKGAKLQWREAESKFFCPKHKARFDSSGDHVSGRRSRNLDRFAIRIQEGNLVVDTDAVLREDGDSTRWRNAFIELK